MCTSGSADLLIVATSLGSMVLYNLNNIRESNPSAERSLNYTALLEHSVKDWLNLDLDKQKSYMTKCLNTF